MESPTSINLETLTSYCKSKGFVFPTSEIYGGLGGFFDYGHLGTQLKRNIINEYWKFFVLKRENIIAQDGSIITNPSVWKASGHLDNFDDPILTTFRGNKYRADHFIEEKLGMMVDGMSCEEMLSLIHQNNLKFNGESIVSVNKKNLMFSTVTGTSEHSQQTVYMRPETCQAIFCNAKLLSNLERLSLPFGIVQIGKAFRNEIHPRNFIFRCREFEQIEMEFFHSPDVPCEVLTEDHKNIEILCMYADERSESIKLGSLLDQKLLSEYHLYWLAEMLRFLIDIIGLKPSNLRIREHNQKELSHYSSATFDIDFLYPFTDTPVYKELCGIANRGNFDITQHAKHSKKNLYFRDDYSKKKIYPHVIEPSIGLDRLFLAIIANGYEYDTDRDYIVMHMKPKLCPNEYAVFPLPSKNWPKSYFYRKARDLFENLIDKGISAVYDQSGSIGRRYARQDGIGTMWCLTVDETTLEDDTVTVRNRDTKEQVRVPYFEFFEK